MSTESSKTKFSLDESSLITLESGIELGYIRWFWMCLKLEPKTSICSFYSRFFHLKFAHMSVWRPLRAFFPKQNQHRLPSNGYLRISICSKHSLCNKLKCKPVCVISPHKEGLTNNQPQLITFCSLDYKKSWMNIKM